MTKFRSLFLFGSEGICLCVFVCVRAFFVRLYRAHVAKLSLWLLKYALYIFISAFFLFFAIRFCLKCVWPHRPECMHVSVVSILDIILYVLVFTIYPFPLRPPARTQCNARTFYFFRVCFLIKTEILLLVHRTHFSLCCCKVQFLVVFFSLRRILCMCRSICESWVVRWTIFARGVVSTRFKPSLACFVFQALCTVECRCSKKKNNDHFIPWHCKGYAPM